MVDPGPGDTVEGCGTGWLPGSGVEITLDAADGEYDIVIAGLDADGNPAVGGEVLAVVGMPATDTSSSPAGTSSDLEPLVLLLAAITVAGTLLTPRRRPVQS